MTFPGSHSMMKGRAEPRGGGPKRVACGQVQAAQVQAPENLVWDLMMSLWRHVRIL